MPKNTTKKTKPALPAQKRAYVKQSDVPGTSLDEALRVPAAILDHFRVLSGAAIPHDGLALQVPEEREGTSCEAS